MIANVHIVRKALICMSLWIALTVELAIFGAAAFVTELWDGPSSSTICRFGGGRDCIQRLSHANSAEPAVRSSRFDPGGEHCGTQRLQYDDTAEPASERRHRDPVGDHRDFAGGARQWKGAAHGRLLCRIGKSPRLAGL